MSIEEAQEYSWEPCTNYYGCCSCGVHKDMAVKLKYPATHFSSCKLKGHTIVCSICEDCARRVGVVW